MITIMNTASGILTNLLHCYAHDRTSGQTGSNGTDVRASSQNRFGWKFATHLVLQVNGEVGFKWLIPHFAGKAEREMTELWQEQKRGKPQPRPLPKES